MESGGQAWVGLQVSLNFLRPPAPMVAMVKEIMWKAALQSWSFMGLGVPIPPSTLCLF